MTSKFTSFANIQVVVALASTSVVISGVELGGLAVASVRIRIMCLAAPSVSMWVGVLVASPSVAVVELTSSSPIISVLIIHLAVPSGIGIAVSTSSLFSSSVIAFELAASSLFVVVANAVFGRLLEGVGAIGP